MDPDMEPVLASYLASSYLWRSIRLQCACDDRVYVIISADNPATLGKNGFFYTGDEGT
jgi:hypothetical protein